MTRLLFSIFFLIPLFAFNNDKAVSYDKAMDFTFYGLSNEILTAALKGQQRLQDSGFHNPLLTIVDFSQSSRKKRLYIIDTEKKELLINTYVSHGKNSGVDMAKNFSNEINSEKSSLGLFITTKTYVGKHGTSLRLQGVDKGINDNAAIRGIVIHGAAYVNEYRVNTAYMGRSQGCPALPEKESKAIIELIKDTSTLFLYHPEYLK